MAVASEDEHRWLAAEQGDPARGESGVHASVDAVIRSRWNEARVWRHDAAAVRRPWQRGLTNPAANDGRAIIRACGVSRARSRR
jgi:hypothetical protein